jgi:hypothetical protein
MAQTYRWGHPSEWLNWKLTELAQADKLDEILGIARELATAIDGDTIQDLFQSDMYDDGYFKGGNE